MAVGIAVIAAVDAAVIIATSHHRFLSVAVAVISFRVIAAVCIVATAINSAQDYCRRRPLSSVCPLTV